MVKTNKPVQEVLEQQYISAYDLQIIIPHLAYNKALKYIEMFRTEMEEKNYFVPEGKTKVALTKLVRKKLGL